MNSLPMMRILRVLVGAGEDAVLIVEETRVLDRQIRALRSDAGTILIWNARALEGDVAYSDVVSGSDQQRLSAAGLVRQDDALALAFDGHVIPDDGSAIEILARIDVDRVAIFRGGDCLAWRLVLLALSHLQCSSQKRDGPNAHRDGKQRPRDNHHQLLTSNGAPPLWQLSWRRSTDTKATA